MKGAQPKQHGSWATKKPDFSGNWDIERSGPRALHIGECLTSGLNKYAGPDLNLNNNDIPGSKPNCVKFKSNWQNNDPLNPRYQLSQVEMRPITPPKFIRDQIAHDDIDGSKPRKAAYYKTWETMKVDDIQGSKPRSLTSQRNTRFSNIDYRDVTHCDFKSKRHCNPLNPTYKVRDENDKVSHIGMIEGNQPRKNP